MQKQITLASTGDFQVQVARGEWVRVRSLADASETVRRYIAANRLPADKFAGGKVKMNGQTIAQVFANGQVWAVKVGRLLFQIG